MSNQIKELREMIAVSLYIIPCDFYELINRDFLKNKSEYGIEMLVHQLDMDGAICYTNTKQPNLRKEVMHIRKSYMKKQGLLTKYELI